MPPRWKKRIDYRWEVLTFIEITDEIEWEVLKFKKIHISLPSKSNDVLRNH